MLVAVIVIAEVALATPAAVAIARRLRRTVPLATLAAAIRASAVVPAPVALAPLAAIAPAAVAAEAVVVAPLVEARALVAVVVALADKRYVNPYLNPL